MAFRTIIGHRLSRLRRIKIDQFNLCNQWQKRMEEGIYSDITSKIIGCSLNVHNFLGCGFSEEVYHRALFKELKWQKLYFVSRQEIEVYYKDNELLGVFYPDFVVEDKIVVEIKAAEGICDEYVAQTLNYLKASNLELALLINFGAKSLQIKRLINKHYRPQIKITD